MPTCRFYSERRVHLSFYFIEYSTITQGGQQCLGYKIGLFPGTLYTFERLVRFIEPFIACNFSSSLLCCSSDNRRDGCMAGKAAGRAHEYTNARGARPVSS